LRSGRGCSPPGKAGPVPAREGGYMRRKGLLVTLQEAAKVRGDALRAAKVRDIAMRRFPSEEYAAALEMKTVEALLRAGQEREALERTIKMIEVYGPGPPGHGRSRLRCGRERRRTWQGC